MQNIILYVSAQETLGIVKDYANAKAVAPPTLVRGVGICLRLRLFANADGLAPYPMTALSDIVSWQWAMDTDFNESTACKLAGDNPNITTGVVTECVDGETVNYTEICIPIPDMNTVELSAWLGAERSKSGLHGELVGFNAKAKQIYILQIENFTVRNRITGSGNPTENKQEYLTATQINALIAAGVVFQYSEDGTSWHDTQKESDFKIRMRSASDANAVWSEAVALIPGPQGESGNPDPILAELTYSLSQGLPGQVLMKTADGGFAWMWAADLPKECKVVLALPLLDVAETAETEQVITPTGMPKYFADLELGRSVLQLDGNSYLTVGTASLPTVAAARTLSVWAKSDVAVTTNKCIFCYGAASGANKVFGLSLLPDNAVAIVGGGGTDYQNASETNMLDQTVWNHFCATYDGAVENLYVNGTLVATKTILRDTAAIYARVGTWVSAGADNHFTGRISNLKVYDNVLTKQEISALAER